MSHAREQIRDQAVTVLTGLATTGANVYRSRVYPHDTLPCLSIYTVEEALDEDLDVMGTKEFRTLTLRVEGRAQATADLDETLDDISAEVETAMYADQTLSALVKHLVLESTGIELSGELEKPTGVVRLDFVLLYRIDAADPTTIIA